MASNRSTKQNSEFGIIFLGNAGSGKSFLCNLLIGSERFEADFRPEAVTTVTEHHKINIGSSNSLIYNIPGLVEVNQTQIDRNKREIMRAFEECPESVVIFVWTHVGGRAQNDDVIAFGALNDAYRFPPESLLFVVNNIPVNRRQDYEALFIVALGNALKPIPVSAKDTIFIDALGPDDGTHRERMRSKLIQHITFHQARQQKKIHDIVLQSDQLKQMRELIKKQQQEAERDRALHQKRIEEMAIQYKSEQDAVNRRYEALMQQMNEAHQQHQRDREDANQRYAQLHKELKSVKTQVPLKCGGKRCPKCDKCQTHQSLSGGEVLLGTLTILPLFYMATQTYHDKNEICQC